MLRDIDHPMSILWKSEDEAVWFENLADFGRQYGFEYTRFAVLPRPGMQTGDFFLRTNYPVNWTREYQTRGYERIDPTVRHCLTKSMPLAWSSSLFVSDAERELYQRACQHGIRSGVVLPIHGPNHETGLLCFSTDQVPSEGGWQDRSDRLPELSLLRDIAFDSALKYVRSHCSAHMPKLTRREKECLKWASCGKTTWEVAQIMACSEATINFHMMNVRSKLGVHSKGAAVLKAVQIGLIDPV